MADILIIYSSTDGHTIKISRFIASILTQKGNRVTLTSIENVAETDLSSYNKIILGASIRYGRHKNNVYQFIQSQLSILSNRSSAFFSVNVVARKKNKNCPQTNPYVKKFLNEIKWQPDLVGVFAGKIDYPSYRFWDKQIIRLIMWLTKGPTDPGQIVEFTNWQDVEDFALRINSID